MVNYIPNGPKNLKSLFPAIDFNQVKEYFVEILDEDGATVATSTLNKMGCCCNEDTLRIHFLNYLGTYDAVNFNNNTILHKSVSETYRKGLPNVLSKTDTGMERTNIRSNDTKSGLNNCYDESNNEWLQELADSPKAFEEWKGTQSQADSYLPIVILDKDLLKLKTENRFTYDFTIEYIMANDVNAIRN